ncbi:hypothetical protein HHI36_001707 [Cryptolaemus montrouzieri]|uniref:Glucosylceramidase n=1 Tax=Cryptolaemus montrouzieri TaxID=559131 RepID=A0ABD2P8Q8_9CUCU
MAIDDQRFFYPEYVSHFMENKTTADYIDGFSVHWYADTIIPPAVLSETHDRFPDKFILSAEASNGFLPPDKHGDIGSWERGQAYANDIIDDLNNWSSGWVDWNLALNINGGPTYIDTFIDSSILVNATAQEFYKQPMYYAIGHFSKFIPENSVRIDLSPSIEQLPIVAVTTPEPANKTVLVILNKFDNSQSISFQDGSDYINLNLEGKSITTVIF